MRAGNHLTLILQNIISAMGYSLPAKLTVEPPKDKSFGDLAVNCAMLLAKEAGLPPRALAEDIATRLRAASPDIANVAVAGPGFLNITFSPTFWQENIAIVEKAGSCFGTAAATGKKVQVEFVSANPTGPLHIGHGRGAAVGDSLCRILTAAGHTVSAEYYINDAGKQMRTLGKSIWLRALALTGKSDAPFPEDCYQGSYIIDSARALLSQNPQLTESPEAEGIDACYAYGMRTIFAGIKQDLADFDVQNQEDFSELSLTHSGAVERALAQLEQAGHTFIEGGAFWFRTTPLGDDKDRVLRKSDGSLTYFASDIAYHANKYERGFDHVIDVWGADHHGYIPRMRAAITALGRQQSDFDVVLVQLVNLLRDGEQIAMSTRAGQFETLSDVLKEVGADAARFMFLSRKSDSKLDFDLALVKQRTMDNPVYYVQYAHARIQAVWRRAAERNLNIDAHTSLACLTQEEELDLLRMLDRFPQVVNDAAANLAPHYISYYLMDLAGLLHRYYAAHSILGGDDAELMVARLRLLRAVGYVLRNGLNLLGVSAPETM